MITDYSPWNTVRNFDFEEDFEALLQYIERTAAHAEQKGEPNPYVTALVDIADQQG